ncbi:MAG TPA: VWA domain-containing protein [Gemmatimonadaceae bacterium]|nr:VWA domain-containing protein [Gemmatimonadaceae bacterium]
MTLADPWALLLLVVVAADALWSRDGARVGLPVDVRALPVGRARWVWVPRALRTAGLVCCVIALARPRANGEVRDTRLTGRSIMLTLDISSSMKAPDFRAGSRLVMAKQVLSEFVKRRTHDFLGLVLFAGRAFTQAPLTNDGPVVLDLLDRADIGLLPDGTAIGTALAMGEVHLADVPRGTGVIVMLTDGGNNAGTPDPLTAAAAARALGIRIYTVGVSARAVTPTAPYLTGRPASMESPSALTTVEERLLRQIATTSGGQYFRATDDNALRGIMDQIDQAERSELHVTEVLSFHEYFWVPLALGLVLLVASLALRMTILRTVP